MKLFWGLLLLSLGLLILATNLNYYNCSNFSDLIKFWPMILILFGITIIFKNFKFGWIIILLAFILALFFIHSLLLGNQNYNINNFYLNRLLNN